MQSFVTFAGLAVGASAAILPRNDGCCFQLTASGGQSGTLGQLDDGQNRIGGGLGQATYCISGGSITDSSGRGCILTSPTTQFQCDKGSSPDGGFSVNNNGMLEHSGDSTFYACPAGDNEYNIYTQKLDNQPKCVEVTLSTGGKCSGGSASKSPSGYSSPSVGQQTCPPQQTITKTEQGMDSTIYKTKTIEATETKPTTIYQTKTVEETQTQTKPTTVYKTSTVQTTITAETPTTVYKTSTVQTTITAETPTTVYQTKTQEETQTVPTTVYQTKTEQRTVTAQTPTTVYKTKTEEETQTQPTTVYQMKTEQRTTTAETPTTVYQTKTVEETETKKLSPQTETVTKTEEGQPQTITKAVTQYQTQQASPTTIYKTKEVCSSEGGGKASQTQTQTQKGSACPTNLSGSYETPHLIVPVSSESPDQSYGTSYNGAINASTSSIFNFDIPKSYEGQTCSLVFLFPKKADLETSDFTFNGQGSVSVDHLSSAADQQTTWNSVPKADDHLGSFSPQPGNSYVVSTDSCAAGSTQSYELSAAGGLDLEYFQDYNPSPIGLYITTC